MEHYLPPLCCQAIKHVCHDAKNIRFPDVEGKVAPVFLADTQNKTLVFKFSDEQIVKKNLMASQLMRQYDIKMPDINIHQYQGTWFEVYQYNPIKTLYEQMQSGLSMKHIFAAYSNAVHIQYQISQIPVSDFRPVRYRTYSEILLNHVQNMPFPIAVYRKILAYNARMGRQMVLHNDVHPGNILYSPETGETHLLDLDAVGVSGEQFAALKMVYQYPLENYGDILDVYELISGHKLNRLMINAACKMMENLHQKRQQIINVFKASQR